ncbi:hypothetical protein BKA66DRAFT_575156 [Pyrenochaeta sp. MPI-SDFR-AT-0127]|nr:hypothetical protein BKA66DRAFT_575156 [Pyrenochaeta sp. MPI-SDFR-AT-0127]
MLLNILAIYVLAQGLAVAQNLTDVPWPNSFPKQLAAVRRRQGLTTSEFTYHHAIVHGRKSWNAPDSVDQPLAYVQDHVFDSAYGINTTANHAHVNYFGHNDMTELYSRSEEAFATPPPNNYTATVIGPDGNAFNDVSCSINMFGREVFYEVKDTCQPSGSSTTFNAFYWVFANASNANTSSFDNTTFAAPIMRNLLAAFSPGTIYNASVHTSVPGLESRSYYGGFNNPTLNAVLKFWLCDDYSAVAAFRNAQLGLISQNDELGINLDQSFVIFTRAVLIYDRSTNTPFDTDRVAQALRANRFRDTVGGPP